MNYEILISTAVGAFIGSFLTLIATFLSHKLQCSSQKKREENQVHGFLQAIHDEIETLWEVYIDGMGNRLETLGENQPLTYYYPITQEYFIVYTTNASLLGKIKDHDLRKNIVSTYIKAKGLIDSYKMNNGSIYKYEHAHWIFQETNNPIHQASMNAHRQALVEYAKELKKSHNEMKQKTQGLLRELRIEGVLSKK